MIKIVFILRIRIQISSLEKISSFISNHECIRPVVTKSPVKRSVFFSFFHLAFLVQINSDLSSSGATRALRAKLDIEKDPMDDITTVYQTQDIYIYIVLFVSTSKNYGRKNRQQLEYSCTYKTLISLAKTNIYIYMQNIVIGCHGELW